MPTHLSAFPIFQKFEDLRVEVLEKPFGQLPTQEQKLRAEKVNVMRKARMVALRDACTVRLALLMHSGGATLEDAAVSMLAQLQQQHQEEADTLVKTLQQAEAAVVARVHQVSQRAHLEGWLMGVEQLLLTDAADEEETLELQSLDLEEAQLLAQKKKDMASITTSRSTCSLAVQDCLHHVIMMQELMRLAAPAWMLLRSWKLLKRSTKPSGAKLRSSAAGRRRCCS